MSIRATLLGKSSIAGSQIVFRFAPDVGMMPLTGITNADHIRADLDVFDFKLLPEEVALIEGLG